jgi:hypothetical protein
MILTGMPLRSEDTINRRLRDMRSVFTDGLLPKESDFHPAKLDAVLQMIDRQSAGLADRVPGTLGETLARDGTAATKTGLAKKGKAKSQCAMVCMFCPFSKDLPCFVVVVAEIPHETGRLEATCSDVREMVAESLERNGFEVVFQS